jgi:hypothetical protein
LENKTPTLVGVSFFKMPLILFFMIPTKYPLKHVMKNKIFTSLFTLGSPWSGGVPKVSAP